MRIAQIATMSAPVRHDAPGSVECLVWLLTRELKKLGHEVTVFGVAGAEVDGGAVATLPGPYCTNGSLEDWHLCEWVNLGRALEQAGRFEVMHSHAYLWGIPLEALVRTPMAHTLHIVPDDDAVKLWRARPQACVTAISRHQWSGCPDLKPAAIIPHGADVSQFSLRTEPEDYLLYLGRFTSGKGPRQAIAAAQSLGLRLLLAGPYNAYFRDHVQPLLDGRNVEYIGYLNGEQRNKLLGGARALLYPIQYPEAFGLVLVEAMLCGTPVAAMRVGAVPEIVEEGVAGFTATSPEEFSQTIVKAMTLDRARIRRLAEHRFSAERMAREYACVYEALASRPAQAQAQTPTGP